MGGNALTWPEGKPGRQTFCLTGAAMPAALPLRPDDQWFVGLGFSSNVDAEKMRREPLSLIMVVDRSGSMSGWPIQQVKGALHAVTGKLRKGDRIGIIIYGDEPLTHLAQPPQGEAGTPDAGRPAMQVLFLHWGPHRRGGFALGGLALAFFVCRHDLPPAGGPHARVVRGPSLPSDVASHRGLQRHLSRRERPDEIASGRVLALGTELPAITWVSGVSLGRYATLAVALPLVEAPGEAMVAVFSARAPEGPLEPWTLLTHPSLVAFLAATPLR